MLMSFLAKASGYNNPLITQIDRHYEICFLEDIDFTRLKLVKEVRSSARTVYYDSDDKVYIKIWPKKYFFSSYFIDALKKNFYRDLAPLKCVIFDESGLCRGYISHALDDYKKEKNFIKITDKKIAHSSVQNDAYRKFFRDLKKRVFITGLIYYDLTPNNVAYDGSDYFLVDLESVLDIESCKKNAFKFHTLLEYNPDEYIEFVKKLLSKK